MSKGNKPSRVRRKEILELLKKREYCTIAGLKEQFGVSIPTIHRDVDRLAKMLLVRKIHGGVEYVAATEESVGNGPEFDERMNRQLKAKKEIARKALTLIKEDDVVFFDSSTTVLHLARKVARSKLRRLTVVTNSCSIIAAFPTFPPSMTLIGLGGTYDGQLHSFLGGMTDKSIRDLRIKKMFFSAVGINAGGAYTFHEDHAKFLERLASRSAAILLLDSSKFGKDAMFQICELSRLGGLISDQKPPKEIVEALGDAPQERLWEPEEYFG